MARLAFRDRFFTPPVARALVSPSGILVAGAGVAVGIVAGLPVVAAVGLGGVAWLVRVGFSVPRRPRADRIDPFALQDPWRSFVRDAQQAATRFSGAVGNARFGPLRDRLNEIQDRLETGVNESWRIARAGQALATARSQIDIRDITYQLTQLNGAPGSTPPAPGSAQAQTIDALEAQVDTVARLDTLLTETVARLRLLDARIDESVARAIELSVRAESSDDLGGLSADVDTLVSELESLRLALDETEPSHVVLPALTDLAGASPPVPDPTTDPDSDPTTDPDSEPTTGPGAGPTGTPSPG